MINGSNIPLYRLTVAHGHYLKIPDAIGSSFFKTFVQWLGLDYSSNDIVDRTKAKWSTSMWYSGESRHCSVYCAAPFYVLFGDKFNLQL